MMNEARKIAKNTLVLLVAQILALRFGFVYTVYAARYLGVAGFGD
jgi:O-antigen/teichoic acid export membrane protein